MIATLDCSSIVATLRSHVDIVAPPEHRWAADHLDVTEAQPVEVLAGRLAAHPDRRRPVQHGGHEVTDHAFDRPDRIPLPVDRALGAHPKHDHGDSEPSYQLGRPDQHRLELRPERVGEGDHVGVEPLVDLVGIVGPHREVVRFDVHAGRTEQLPCSVDEDQVPAVVRDEVPFQGVLRRTHVEGALGGAQEDPPGGVLDLGRRCGFDASHTVRIPARPVAIGHRPT